MELKESTINVLDRMNSFVKRGNILSEKNRFLKNELEAAFHDLTGLLVENRCDEFHKKIEIFMGRAEYEKILGSVIFRELSKVAVQPGFLKTMPVGDLNKNITNQFFVDFKKLCLKQKVLEWKEEFNTLKDTENLVKNSKYKSVRSEYNPEDYEYKVHTGDFLFLSSSFKEDLIDTLIEEDFLDDFLSTKIDLKFHHKGFGTCNVAQFTLIGNFLSKTAIISVQDFSKESNIGLGSYPFLNRCKEMESFSNGLKSPIKYLSFPNINDSDITVYRDDYLDCPSPIFLEEFHSNNKNKYYVSDCLNYFLDVAVLSGKESSSNAYGIRETSIVSFQAMLRLFKDCSVDLNEYNSFLNYRIVFEKMKKYQMLWETCRV